MKAVNPFINDTALEHSAYYCVDMQNNVSSPLYDRELNEQQQQLFNAFKDKILSDSFCCIGAKTALATKNLRFGFYDKFKDPEVTQGLAHDIYEFMRERDDLSPHYTTFIAVFANDTSGCEYSFEKNLWEQLQLLHDLDAEHHEWDEKVASDPSDDHFSYSFANKSFFVVGLHPNASRTSRTFPYTALVFNSREQFDRLREDQLFEPLKAGIRKNEMRINGSLNPMITDYGESSEAPQFSGRFVDKDWKCAFSVKNNKPVAEANAEA